METAFVRIDESNKGSFLSVLPEGLMLTDDRVAIGAVDGEGYVLGAVSFALLGFEYSIDWIYVDELARRKGVGLSLLDEVFKVVMQTGERYPVTARFEFAEQDNGLHIFFLSCKHMLTDYSHERYYVTSSDIRNTESLHKAQDSELRTEQFFDRPESEQKKILARLDFEETYVVSDYERWKENSVPELCKCVFVKNNLVDLIFMQKLPDGNLELSYLYGKYPRGLFELLSSTVSEMERLYPEAKLTFDVMNVASASLAKHLFPRAKTVHVYEAEF